MALQTKSDLASLSIEFCRLHTYTHTPTHTTHTHTNIHTHHTHTSHTHTHTTHTHSTHTHTTHTRTPHTHTPHTHTHTTVGLLWTRDQLVAEAGNYATQNKHARRKSKPAAGFEHAIPATRRNQTYALYRTATRNGKNYIYIYIYNCDFKIFVLNVGPETFGVIRIKPI